MSKPSAGRPGTGLPARSALPLTYETTADAVLVRFGAQSPAFSRVALLLDGRMASVAEVVDGAARLALPPERLGGTCKVAEVPSGRILSVFELRRGEVEWLGWTLRDKRVAGAFRLCGVASAGETVPVELVLDGSVVHTCFALLSEGAWRFGTEIPRLAPVGGDVHLAARVAGLSAGRPLRITGRDCGLAGHLDATERRTIQGWAVDLLEPGRRVEVEVMVNGAPVWRGVASRMRRDVAGLGLSDGRSGFRVPIPKHLPLSQDLHVTATIATTGMQLVDSPQVLPAPPPFMGFFDALEGPFAGGWAVNMHDPASPIEVEAVCDGEVIGSGRADLFRGDVEKAGMPTPRCGFRFLLERPLTSLFDRDIYVRVRGTDQALAGSPRQVSRNDNIARFLVRGASIPPATLHRLARRIAHRTEGLLISIVLPVFDTRREWLVEALTSVLRQWSPHWELICVDDGSTAPHVRQVLDAAARHDRRIRVMRSPGNLGIARATNFGLRAARGDYVAFMDHDDVIEPDAVYKLALAAKQTGADLLYSDEALTAADIDSVIEVRARPAFSYDYYLSHPYFVHMVCVRTAVAQRLGGWDESLPISADVDFILRVIEASQVVTHVPSVLYRWRTHGGSAGHSKQAAVTPTMLGVLDRHLARQGLQARAEAGLHYNEYRIEWPDDGNEVLVVIPTKNRVDLLKTCIDSIERTSRGENYRIVVIDHESTDKKTIRYLKEISDRHTVMAYSGVFNYALMNNLAVKLHGGSAEYYLFLNNDVEAREAGWIARLRSIAARPDVGAVGPLLLYGDRRVQHAGVLVAFSGAADHAMKFQDAYLANGERHPGYNCNLTAVRDYSAVTAACAMVPRRAWRAVGGFDESFVVGFNDTDLCLRIGQAGFKVLYDGFTVLYHHESATRMQTNEVDHPEDDARLRRTWERYFRDGDPFYSPLLSPRGTDHTLRQDIRCKGRVVPRAVHLAWPAATPGPVTKPRRRATQGMDRHAV